MRKMQSASTKPDLQAIFVDQFRNLEAISVKASPWFNRSRRGLEPLTAINFEFEGSIEFARRASHGQSV